MTDQPRSPDETLQSSFRHVAARNPPRLKPVADPVAPPSLQQEGHTAAEFPHQQTAAGIGQLERLAHVVLPRV